MRMSRCLALFALTAGLAVLFTDVASVAQAQTKAEKQAKRKAEQQAKRKAERAKALAAKREEERAAERKAELAAERAAAEKARRKSATPAVAVSVRKDPAAITRLIDEQITAKLDSAKLAPSPVCTDEEFLRRVYLDLTGVIPTAEKARAFLDSTDPNKRAKLVDELLDSPNYGRHLADLWQAKLLPRESGNRFVLREPFIKWMEENFNKNTPWNTFVANLVTASGTVEANPAVTFYLANRSVDKLTDAVSQQFMGIHLQCAQCHNHPFTEIKQTEYWGMAAFFAKVRAQNPRNPNKGGNNTQIGVQEGVQKSRVKDFFPESAKDVPPKFLGGDSVKVTNSEPLRPVLAEWLTTPENPYFAKAMVNRTWGLLFGRGFVNPIDNMVPEMAASHPELLERLSREFAASGFDLKNLYRGICASQAYQRTSKPVGANKDDHKLFSHMNVKVMTPEQLFDSLATVTGTAAERVRPKPAAAKRGPVGARDQFVQFFLAGADAPNATEYEAGIPQALRLMNSRVTGNPALIRAFAGPGAKPAEVIERIYLATLSRRPTPAEVDKLTQYLSKAATPTEGYGDILWVALNSSEFAMVK